MDNDYLDTRLLVGNCVETLKTLDADSIESIVTDPPYEIGFMGKGWDSTGIAYNVDLWRECLRVLKPGGHLLAFGATRSYHRMAVAIEDAGFEIRDSIHWTYGSGFPKSLNVSKQEGCEDWAGWGTALKPSHEPIVVARKPLAGTVAANVLAYGTGALNIDGCRVRTEDNLNGGAYAQDSSKDPAGASSYALGVTGKEYEQPTGRWPANTILTHAADCDSACVPGCPVADLDQQSGLNRGAFAPVKKGHSGKSNGIYGDFAQKGDDGATFRGDTGGASRFFTQADWDEEWDGPQVLYVAKPSKRERNAGLEGADTKRHADRKKDDGAGGANPRKRSNTAKQNFHPTVKPVALMRHLVRLVTPKGSTVLDPFLGSGTTAVAAILEGFEWKGCELTEDYLPIIKGRVQYALDTVENNKKQQPEPDLFQE